MTGQELLEKLQAMTPEERQLKVYVYDEPFDAIHTAKSASVDHSNDLDENNEEIGDHISINFA